MTSPLLRWVLGVRPSVRRGKVLVFSGCKSHPATGSLQPVAIGAAVEVTKPSEPSRDIFDTLYVSVDNSVSVHHYYCFPCIKSVSWVHGKTSKTDRR